MRTASNYCFHYATPDETSQRFHFSRVELERILGRELEQKKPISLSAYVEDLDGVTEETFSLSFDDAHRSVLTDAAPVLRALGLQATLFVPTNYIGLAGFLSWHDLEVLRKDGWEIGAHTQSHPRMSWRLYSESSEAYRERLVQECAQAKRLLETRLGVTVPFFAYPYGEDPEVARQVVRQCGFAAAFNVREDSDWDGDLYAIPRVEADEAFGRVRALASPTRFDVVIPASDRPELLQATLSALALQSYPRNRFAVHVVFDRPSDVPSPSVVGLDCNVVVHRPPYRADVVGNFRAGSSRNFGVGQGDAPHLVFLDADVAVHPDYLWAMDWVHARTPNAVVLGYLSGYNLHDLGVVHDVEAVDVHALRHLNVIPDRQRERVVAQCLDNIDWLREPWKLLYTGNFSMPRVLFENVGGFERSFEGWGLEDIEFGVRAHAAGGAFVFSRFALGFHLCSRLEGPSRNPFRKTKPEQKDIESYLQNIARLRALHPGNDAVLEFAARTEADARELVGRRHTVGIQMGGFASRKSPWHAQLHELRPGGASVWDLLERVEQAERIGATRLWLEGGEPFEHPNFWEVLQYANARCFKVGLRSSLHPLGENPEVLSRARSLGLDHIEVLVLGRSADEHDAFLGDHAAEQLLGGLARVRAIGISHTIDFRVLEGTSVSAEWRQIFGEPTAFLPVSATTQRQ